MATQQNPRVVCDGWEGVHSERRVLSEGSEPVSHGMCAECERAVTDAANVAPCVHTYGRLVRPDCDRCGTNLGGGDCPKCGGI